LFYSFVSELDITSKERDLHIEVHRIMVVVRNRIAHDRILGSGQ